MARILLIDDEDLSRFGVRRALESGGHEVFEASDGKEGVSEFKMMAASGKTPDVTITDILMPVKSGYKTIGEIREISPQANIIAISGGGGGDPLVFLEISKSLGASFSLCKPFTPDELLEMVDRCLA